MTVTTADGSARSVTRPSVAGLGLPVAAAVAATAVFLLVHDALIDDAYITMSYARNVGLHLHWGLIPDEVANSATSPLNVLLLGAATAIVRDGVIAVGVLFVASIVLATRWLQTLAVELGLSRWLPVMGVGLLLVNPLVLSTVGLEPYMCAALLVGLLRYGAAGRPAVFGVVAGLTVLARPDLGVVVAVVSLVLPAVRRRLHLAIATALAVVLPWCVFSWFVLGSAVPDTLVIKSGSATWAGFGFSNGPFLYLNAMPTAAFVSFLPVVVGLLVLVGLLVARLARRWAPWQQVAAAIGLGAVAHYAAYSVLHTAPYHWYYAPMIIGGTLVVSLAAARLRDGFALAAGGLAAGLAIAAIAVDLGNGLPWQRAIIQTNWASATQYQQLGTELAVAAPGATIESPGEIGTIAYYCQCAVVDQFSDRGRVIGAINDREAKSGRIGAFLLRLDHRNLDWTEAPRPVSARLVYQPHQAPAGPLQWPADHWADGPGRIVLEPVAR
ncbi:hypothetical protein ACQEVB_07920 [Pseudonocardia sp. CA-107938]|uniref:hypothetical protein n=1 Tax=Pseudonocardia sp. CA-107938 TaxID=3240021 RepID=UPI003D9180B1